MASNSKALKLQSNEGQSIAGQKRQLLMHLMKLNRCLVVFLASTLVLLWKSLSTVNFSLTIDPFVFRQWNFRKHIGTLGGFIRYKLFVLFHSDCYIKYWKLDNLRTEVYLLEFRDREVQDQGRHNVWWGLASSEGVSSNHMFSPWND